MIYINGEIGWDVTSNDFIKEFNATGEDVEIRIASGGGNVFDGLAIYNAIKDSGKNITVTIDVALSMASGIAMAGNTVKMAKNGMFMLHNVSGGSYGDSKEMQKQAEILEKFNNSIAMGYAEKSGKPIKEILELMDKETWLNAKEALEMGFVDEIINEATDKLNLVAQYKEQNKRGVKMDKFLNTFGLKNEDEAIEKVNSLNSLVASQKDEITNLQTEKAELENKINEFEAEKERILAEQLEREADEFIKKNEKKILPKQVEYWKNQWKTDRETTESIVNDFEVLEIFKKSEPITVNNKIEVR